MLGKSDGQQRFDGAAFWCGSVVPEDSFYAKLYRHGHEWFRDEDFASMYEKRRGRPSVPPAILARAILLQNYDNLSDREVVQRIKFDLRYKMALDVPIDYPGFDPSLLSIFRARLLVHAAEGLAFERSLEMARRSGVLDEGCAQAVDSAPVKGAAAVQDTYTLLRTGIEKVLVAIDDHRSATGPVEYKAPFPHEKYLLKRGKADIDWSDAGQRREHLNVLVVDAHLLLSAVDGPVGEVETVATASDVLRRILEQDVDEAEGGPTIKKGVAKDRIISTNDTDMRHGRKSASSTIDGYKAHITTELSSEVVTAVEVTPANVHDAEPLSRLLHEQQLRGTYPGTLYADCAYGSGDTRAMLRELNIALIAKVPAAPETGVFPKTRFKIDLATSEVTCPAGHTTNLHRARKDDKGREVKKFRFLPEWCRNCLLQSQCTTSKEGRHVFLHYHEDLLQEAREQAAMPGFRQQRKKRLVVERVLSRLKSYGLKATRYFGMRKTRFQALWTAAANNFWRITELASLNHKPLPA